MTRYDCEICRGAGTIRLPIYRRMTALAVNASPVMEEHSRKYPCPECSESVAFARVAVIGTIQAVDTRIDDPEYIEHVKHSAAHNLIEEIIKGGYVKIESGPPDTRELRHEFRVTLGVVSQKQVATLEERVAQRQIEIAQEVTDEAATQINNWDSYYGHSEILKRDAIRMVRESIKAVLVKRAAWRPTTIARTDLS
jgi:hypothetical protein